VGVTLRLPPGLLQQRRRQRKSIGVNSARLLETEAVLFAIRIAVVANLL
jgi:hypothetical protein